MTSVATAVVRAATGDDLAAIHDIYNHYVSTTAVTFDVTATPMAERRQWFEQFGEHGARRLLVAECDRELAGFASSHAYRARPAYTTTVETSVYCAPGLTGRGLGTQLYAALFEAMRGEDLHRAIAGITLPNDASVRLHRRFGFREIGVQHEVGRKFGRYWDVLLLERALG